MNDVTYSQGCVTAYSKRNFNFAIDIYCLNSIAQIQTPGKTANAKNKRRGNVRTFKRDSTLHDTSRKSIKDIINGR